MKQSDEAANKVRPVALTNLNALDERAAREQLARCCGATAWIERMVRARPFADEETLLRTAEAAFESLTQDDWLEAFAHHPKIGDIDSLRHKFAATSAWAGAEQAGARAASELTLHALSDGNRRYEEKFGYIFIICATGKSAQGMLDALQKRLTNPLETELRIAAKQQKQITTLRIKKWVSE